MSTFSDITERKEHQERLDQLAHYDELTGLMNRRFLMVTLQLLLDRVQTTQGKVAVLFVDLDHFKQINDQFGHHEGDLLLQEASQRILASVRQSDIVGRVGGDEFVIVLSRIESYESAQGIALKIIHSLNQVFQLSTSHFIGASVGIAYYPVHGKSMNDLMRHADSAMYRAKNSGRSQFAIFNEDDEDALISHKEIKNLLRRAIENPKKYLQMYYQPLFDPFTSTLISAEALVRLFNEEGKMISPDVFIEIAENEGFMYELGEKIFESVCEFVKNAKNLGYTPPRIAINLSVAQLVNENLFSTFSSIAQSYALEVNTFSYEITETSAMQKLSSILSGIMEFKNAGCLIMLDDFGTGYASLSQIYKLPIDVIKIDKSFTDLIEGQDSSSKKLIHAIISMANALNIDVIVEGVETKEQLEWLMQHNVKKVQGYYFSKPLDGDTFTRNYLACKSEL
jgi:diguanylate cyclase (GGDEF)-like protein